MRLLFFLLAVAAAVGQTKKPGSVEGVVTNSVTGEPVRRAMVSLRNDAQRFQYSALTGEDGRFQFPSVEPAPNYMTSAECDGFAAPPPRRLRDAISVTEDQHVQNVNLKLIPLGAIGGKVVDDGGEPLRGVAVMAMQFEYSPGVKRLIVPTSATTNDRGDYRLIHLQPGRYYLRASIRTVPPVPAGPPERTHSTVPEVGYLPAYFPEGQEIQQAGFLDVRPGADLSGMNFRLRSTPVYHIRGRLIDQAKHPPPPAGSRQSRRRPGSGPRRPTPHLAFLFRTSHRSCS